MISDYLKNRIISSIQNENVFCIFDNNNVIPAGGFKLVNFIAAWGVEEFYSGLDLEKMDKFTQNNSNWILGYMGYDLKNQIFPYLSTNYIDYSGIHEMYFFRPAYILYNTENQWYYNNLPITEDEIQSIIPDNRNPIFLKSGNSDINLVQRMSKVEYEKRFTKIKEHLSNGDIYEMNLCMEFFAENINISPVEVWRKLISISPTPHACLFRNNEKWLICASPERYIMKKERILITQPIKGTSRRGKDETEDQKLKIALLNNPKERSENVMIVDLMRNDLARCSVPGSIKIHELFGIYTFRTVHQMISTIVSTALEKIRFAEIIKNTFPMGSMTGCPKIRSMQIIDSMEQVSRGLFSGTAGFIMPNGDFDFNVVIRSIIYNEKEKYLSFQAGSAITWNSIMDEEYNECILKAEAMKRVLTMID